MCTFCLPDMCCWMCRFQGVCWGLFTSPYRLVATTLFFTGFVRGAFWAAFCAGSIMAWISLVCALDISVIAFFRLDTLALANCSCAQQQLYYLCCHHRLCNPCILLLVLCQFGPCSCLSSFNFGGLTGYRGGLKRHDFGVGVRAVQLLVECDSKCSVHLDGSLWQFSRADFYWIHSNPRLWQRTWQRVFQGGPKKKTCHDFL